jgi:kynurenine formamidase
MAAVPPSANLLGESWCPSKYGPDDQIGAANLLTPDVVRSALALVRQSRVLSLGLELNREAPGYPPRKFELYGLQTIGTNLSNNDDLINVSLNTGTQMDSLAHLGADGVFYNGHKAADFVAMDGLKKLGAEHIPPMVTRGLLLEMAALKGRRLYGGEVTTQADAGEALRRIDKGVWSGDVVLFHTGWMDHWRKGSDLFWNEEPDPGSEVANSCARPASSASAPTLPGWRPTRTSGRACSSPCTRSASPSTACTCWRTSTPRSWSTRACRSSA